MKLDPSAEDTMGGAIPLASMVWPLAIRGKRAADGWARSCGWAAGVGERSGCGIRAVPGGIIGRGEAAWDR